MEREPAVEFDFRTLEPNDVVGLYSDQAEVVDILGHRASGECVVELTWSPTPRVVFTLQSPDLSRVDVGVPGELCLSGLGVRLKCFVYRRSTSSFDPPKEEIRGFVSGDIGEPGLVSTVAFHAVNFPAFLGSVIESHKDAAVRVWMGRMHWQSPNWDVVLDSANDTPQGAIGDRLNQQGGFAITHAGVLKQPIDRASFMSLDPVESLNALSQFLSFVAGARSAVVLPKGLDRLATVVWQRWEGPSVEPWKVRLSCFPAHVVVPDRSPPVPDLNPVFSRFMESWDDPDWRALLRIGVGWYVMANAHHSTETKIILAQAGLELAAWTLLVPRRMSKGGFEKLNAADCLRLLLSEAHVPLGVPRTLVELADFAKRNVEGKSSWDDGPQALTEVRNLLVHPTKKLSPLDLPGGVPVEIAEMALWYLQLSLMFLLGYKDVYLNRVAGWQQELVPWVVRPPESSVAASQGPSSWPALKP